MAEATVDLLSGFPVVIDLAVAWGDMDAYRHVNNVVYFRYFENVRIEYFRRLGWTDFNPDAGIGPIVAATEARYRKPLRYPDTIQVAARVTTLGEDRLVFEYRLVSRQLAAVATEGKCTIVTVDYGTGKKVPVPPELRRKIEALEGRQL
jgi:acyl-CoA thioester hydrolase